MTAELILSGLDILIWPFVLVLLVFSFHKSIQNLLGRIVEFSLPGGVSGKTAAAVQQDSDKPDLDAEAPYLIELIEKQEGQLSEVQKTNEDLQQQLITAEIELDFERIYNVIFSSQIDLLLKMNNFDDFHFSDIEDHFNKTRFLAQEAFDSWDVHRYIQFLITNSIIEYSENNGFLRITLKGKAFLEYLSARGYKKYGI